ncbi:MAG: hypothetical protein U0791_16885 [Gemmataceae bacterium]
MTDFAEFPGSEAWTRFVTNCLAVVGAFIAGYIGGGVGGWAIDKWLFAKRSPDAAKKAIRVLCGLVLAVLVGFLVFGAGGGRGWFGGGGGSNGSDKSSDGVTNPSDSKSDSQDPPKIDSPKVVEPKPDDPRIRVTFLGGDAVQADRFYMIDDDPVPKSFLDLKSIVLKRRDATTAPLTLVVLFPTDPRQRIDPNSINVAQVTSWAKTQGITITIPADK